MTLSNGEKYRAVGFNRGQLELLVLERNDAMRLVRLLFDQSQIQTFLSTAMREDIFWGERQKKGGGRVGSSARNRQRTLTSHSRLSHLQP